MERDMLDRFIEQVIEGYLLEDLRSMAEAPATRPPYGGIGYPMLATTAAGIELLGLLLMPDGSTFDPGEGRKHFANYWNGYLVPSRPIYRGLGILFYQLIRHGIAHSFSAKGNIIVTKNQPPSVRVDREREALVIDCVGFYRDFEASYWERARPILRRLRTSPDVPVAHVQAMLNELLRDQTTKAVAAFRELPVAMESEVEIAVPHPSVGDGPTGPFGGTITPR